MHFWEGIWPVFWVYKISVIFKKVVLIKISQFVQSRPNQSSDIYIFELIPVYE